MRYPDDFINKIICGDCLEVMPNIPDDSIDMVLCDLPYGTTACKWDTIIPFEPLWEQYKRIIQDSGAIVLTASQPFTSKLVMSNLKMFKYEWIWDKIIPTGFQISKYRPMMRHENICIFGKGKINYYPILWKRDKVESGYVASKSESSPLAHIDNMVRRFTHWYPQSILKYSNANRTHRYHPTQKPVFLFKYLIETYSEKNDIVLDNCIGVGTTAIAAKKIGRKYIGIEVNPEYCNIARRRVNATMGPLF